MTRGETQRAGRGGAAPSCRPITAALVAAALGALLACGGEEAKEVDGASTAADVEGARGRPGSSGAPYGSDRMAAQGGRAPSLRVPPPIPEETWEGGRAEEEQAAPDDDPLAQIEQVPFRESGEEAVEKLRPWLRESDPDLREAAVMALASVEGPEASRALAEQARQEPDPGLKQDIVDELIDREAPETLDTLLHLLNDPDPELREYAADGLDEIGDERAIPALQSALSSEPEEFVRDAILFALEGLGVEHAEEAEAEE
jgi:hypothetical protein